MPTFKNEPRELRATVDAQLKKHDCYAALLEHKVRIDCMFAYANVDERGNPIGHAITVNGIRAFGKCKVVPLKDRAKFHGDVEVIIDGDHWEKIEDEAKDAIVDHELYHISLNRTKTGIIRIDDLGRPKIKLRKHDYQFGWFTEIARRHGHFSEERRQATLIYEESGQIFWPTIFAMANGDVVERAAQAVRRS